MFHSYSILNPTFPTPYGISFTYFIESIVLKFISACLIIDYSFIDKLHIFVYERAELSSISLECTTVQTSNARLIGVRLKLLLFVVITVSLTFVKHLILVNELFSLVNS